MAGKDRKEVASSLWSIHTAPTEEVGLMRSLQKVLAVVPYSTKFLSKMIPLHGQFVDTLGADSMIRYKCRQ